MTTAARFPVAALAAVLFDLDGVLVDSFPAWVAVLDEARTARGLAALGVAAVRRAWGQGIAVDAEQWFGGADVADLAREYDARFARHLALIERIAGADEVLARVAAAGLPAAVVTNTPRALALQILRGVGLDRRFAIVAAGDEVARGKPDPDLVRLALSRLGVPADRSVMVGDTTFDVVAARAAGVPVVGLGVEADARIESLAQLPALLGV